MSEINKPAPGPDHVATEHDTEFWYVDPDTNEGMWIPLNQVQPIIFNE